MLGHAADRWSIPVGHWEGYPLRLHLSLLFTLLVTLALTVGAGLSGHGTAGVRVSDAAILTAVLLIGVLLHEVAHWTAALWASGDWLGGDRDHRIILTPIGGLRLPGVPSDPESQLLVAMVGPMANLLILVVAAGLLAYFDTPPTEMLTLYPPAGLLDGAPMVIALKAAVWINWLTFLVCLLPVYPFDGRAILRASLWPLFGRRAADVVTAQVGRIIAIVMALVAVFMFQLLPPVAAWYWAPLGALALIVLCSAQYELARAAESGGLLLSGDLADPQKFYRVPAAQQSASGDDLVLDLDSELELDQQWRPQELDPRALEDNEDAAVDAILARLHSHGPQDLSEQDRRVLERASRRYRERRRGQTSSD
jgi:Zn-dependent protease